ncbi:MAG: hypothetical protein AAF447_08925 [Myxococcota bacterium]
MMRWHSLAALVALPMLGGCFSSVVDGRVEDDVSVPEPPDLGTVDLVEPAPDLAPPSPPDLSPPPACEPRAEAAPELRFVELGVDADCVAGAFEAPRSVMVTSATVARDGALRFEILTSLVRDGDYRCALEVRGLGEDAARVVDNFGAMRFALLQVRDQALALLPNDIFCEAPLCPLPIGLWVGSIFLPAEGPLPAVDWLRLEAGEAECEQRGRCPQQRFPVRAFDVREGDREIDLRVAPGEVGEAPLTPPVLGAERVVVRVFQSGIDCGPADGRFDRFVQALVYTVRE